MKNLFSILLLLVWAIRLPAQAGKLDASFANTGNKSNEAKAIIVQPDGKLNESEQ